MVEKERKGEVKGRVQEEERKVKIEERMGKGRVKAGERKVKIEERLGKMRGKEMGKGG